MHQGYKQDYAKGVEIFGIRIKDISRLDLVNSVVSLAKSGEKKRVYNVNVHALNIAYCCPRFRNSLRNADILFCDGVGVIFASFFARGSLRYRNTPPDWMDDLAENVCANELSMYFCGDEEGVASEAARLMAKRHPGLDIRGTMHGFFNKYNSENEKVISRINATEPNILLVGMGMPLQEFWIDNNFAKLKANVFLPIGAGFRFYSGIEKRAPKVLTDRGLEWFTRLIAHPVHHFKRYLIGNPLFFARIIKKLVIKDEMSNGCSREIFHGCSNGCKFFQSNR